MAAAQNVEENLSIEIGDARICKDVGFEGCDEGDEGEKDGRIGSEDDEERLASLSRASGPLRRAATAVAAGMVACRGWERLGYARVGDYARERLGQSGRTLTEWARVERGLSDLPRLEAALVSGLLPWSKVRLLARFVSLEDEAFWIAKAARMSSRALEHAVRAVDRGAADLSTALETDEEGASTEEREWVRVRGSPRMAFAWSHVCRMASRVAGERLPRAVALEWVTAEVLSALPVAVELESEGEGKREEKCEVAGSLADRAEDEPALEIGRSPAHAGAVQSHTEQELGLCDVDDFAERAPPELPGFVRPLVDGLDDADPFELDERLRRVVRLEQRLDSEIAPLLRRVVDARSGRRDRRNRREGNQSFASYARDCLGMSPRKAHALIRLEELSDACPELRTAFRAGDLSWVQAQVLAPLLVRDLASPSVGDLAGDRPAFRTVHWRANWLSFAQRVTVRRLEDVVRHALLTGERDPEVASLEFGLTGNDSAEVIGHEGEADPAEATGHERQANPADAQSKSSELQMCARPTQSDMRIQMRIHAPQDVARLFHATLCAVRKLLEQPLGRLPDAGEAFETMIDHALSTWEAQDPSVRRSRPNQRVFERDGWQCTVPGCSLQRNLQAHHIVFRSAGGGDALENQTTLCAFHHHRGVHARRVGVRGSAPQRLRFELGIRPGKAPLIAYRSGDRLS